MSQLVSSISNISRCLIGMEVRFSAGWQEGGLGADFSIDGEGQEFNLCLPWVLDKIFLWVGTREGMLITIIEKG